MVRERLAELRGHRRAFSGVFRRYGHKWGWKDMEKTVLLQNIRDVRTGRVVADHVWLTQRKRFREIGELKSGDCVEFQATVRCYVKGYVNEWRDIDERTIDYQLSNPYGVKRVEPKTVETKPLSSFLG